MGRTVTFDNGTEFARHHQAFAGMTRGGRGFPLSRGRRVRGWIVAFAGMTRGGVGSRFRGGDGCGDGWGVVAETEGDGFWGVVRIDLLIFRMRR